MAVFFVYVVHLSSTQVAAYFDAEK